eukprot:CAMPEP_0198227062 /NCGR_PEP_ID=MMETSP1445-20131203/107695_1 /TAXON_ID=36898 /ORGANISM="Pyramimonas sp., Strain CCMP2087" /LENGTH=273 /DNA_ID=CAMNT_0043907015 /DNA_START=662 /DNA_END=1483 /DNA_ORIENTATION=-
MITLGLTLIWKCFMMSLTLPMMNSFADCKPSFLPPFNCLPEPATHVLSTTFINNWLATWPFYLFLSVVSDLVAFGFAALGYKCVVTFRNPLVLSSSPHDFWGRRWNMVVHGFIRRSCFVPLLRQLAPQALAARPPTVPPSGAQVATPEQKQVAGKPAVSLRSLAVKIFAAMLSFFLSGLMHEYLCAVAFPGTYFTLTSGMQMQFFMWQGYLTSTELVLRALTGLNPHSLPRAVSWVLTMAMLTPSAHLFFEPMRQGGFIKSVSHMMPHIQIRM